MVEPYYERDLAKEKLKYLSLLVARSLAGGAGRLDFTIAITRN